MQIKIIKPNKYRYQVGVCMQSQSATPEMHRMIREGIAVEITQKEFLAFVSEQRIKQFAKEQCDECKKKNVKCKKCDE